MTSPTEACAVPDAARAPARTMRPALRVGALAAVGLAGSAWPMLTVVLRAHADASLAHACWPLYLTSALIFLACLVHVRGWHDAARVLVVSLALGAALVVLGPFYEWPRIAYVPRETYVALGAGAGVALACIAAVFRAGRAHPLAPWWAAGAVAVTTCWLVGLYAWPRGW